MKKWTTLEMYFRRAVATGLIDFAIRAECKEDGRVVFYIHPANASGETADFEVNENRVQHNRDIS